MTTLAIAGWRVRIECGSTEVDKAVVAWYGAFVVPDEAVYDVSLKLILSADATEVSFDPWPERHIRRQGRVCVFDMPGAYGTIDLDSWQATLEVGREVFQPNVGYFLKALYAYLALYRGGVLLHAAGVLSDSAVYIFTGGSGSGKSTVVDLLPDALALNDDLIILRPDARGWRAYGTPFWNPKAERRDGQSADGVVAGIYKLVKDQQDFLETISMATAISELAASCPSANTDQLELPTLMVRCHEVVEAVKVLRLHFRKSADFWPLVHSGDII